MTHCARQLFVKEGAHTMTTAYDHDCTATEQEMANLSREKAELEAERNETMHNAALVAIKYLPLERQNRALMAALKSHGQHTRSCYRIAYGLAHTTEDQCDCGLYAALREAT